jgi:hypothetical protein
MVGATSDLASDDLFGRGVPGWQCEACNTAYVFLNERPIPVECSGPMNPGIVNLTRHAITAAVPAAPAKDSW